MAIDPNIKFKRTRKGYDPQEVDAVFVEFQRQLDDLRQQNRTLSDTVSQFNEKINQVEQNTDRLEQDRLQANLRVAGVLDKAMRVAEETEQEARKKSEEMIKAAQLEAQRISDKAWEDTASTRGALTNVSHDLQNIWQINQQFSRNTDTALSELDTLLNGALHEIPAAPPFAQPPAIPDFSNPQPVVAPNPYLDFNYEKFIKDIESHQQCDTQQQNQHPGHDRIIGYFGDT